MSDKNGEDNSDVINDSDARIAHSNSNVLHKSGIGAPPKVGEEVNEQEMEDIQLSDSRDTPNDVDIAAELPISRTSQAEPVNNNTENPLEKITITISQLPDEVLKHTTVIHSSEEAADETFSRLKEGFLNNSLPQKEITNGLFNMLVGGPFDLESRFIIEHPGNIDMMLEFIDICPQNMQAEIWSVFVAIVRKSFRNLEACSCIGLILKCLDRLSMADAIISDFLIQLLCVLSNYSITVKETKRVLRALQARDGVWSKNSAKLLSVMQEMSKREGADVFFSFPGKASAGIALPPLHKWPYQNGWTFSTWFRMDPLNSVNFEKETPYLFSFGTAKGLGYHCYFMGNCLVLRCTRAANKELTRCIRHELTPRKWHHVALSYVYSRWGKGEIHCYIDGQLVEAVESSWVISSTADYFDRCFVGCGYEANINEAFCGQIAAIYVFSQSISVHQANCLYRLGASYQSHFKHNAESNLLDGYKKHLFDGRLNSSLVFAYCPKNYHGQLCLFPQSQSRSQSSSYFVQVPHAIMRNGVEVITTHSIHNSLHSVGGIQMLLPFFAQIDMPHQNDSGDPAVDYEICLKLLSVISVLLSTSASVQQQLFHSQGFLIIAYVLKTSAMDHLSLRVLESFIAIAKQLQSTPIGLPLLKQLFEHVFFTPQLWIRTSASIQLRLYNFLANDFFANANFPSVVSRTETIVGLMHTLKVYYYIVPPSRASDYSVHDRDVCVVEGERLDRATVLQIRSHILQLVNQLMFGRQHATEERDMNRDEEFQCIFNFIATVHEDDNLYDVLNQTMHQICEHPAVMVPAFDRKKGLCVIFELIKSGNELIRIPTLKTFAYFLCRSTMKRKNESINNLNLLYLLVENILTNCRYLTIAIYNALFELLTEQISGEILFVEHEDLPVDTIHFENPPMLKVIATLIIQSEECDELLKVKRLFLHDFLRSCKDSRENRRVILQMSVWQEWLISLAYVFPENAQQEQVTAMVYDIFAVLLFHAVRLEYGGWRVWVDTLAIAHSKVSWQKHRRKSAKNALRSTAERDCRGDESLREGSDEISDKPADSERPSPLYRTPNFVWSEVHVRLLGDLLTLIEDVVEEWNSSTIPVVDHVGHSDNQVFISNVIHVLSQLIDSLIMACGGLLPLLAAATAPNSELDIVDSTQQELKIETAVQFLQRFIELADVFMFASGVNLNELEQEKNMPSGGILRQSLRLVSTMAVRNILACRINQKDRGFSEISISSREKYVAILKFVDKAMELTSHDKGISNVDSLLQEVDLKRLKGVIYRDMEEGRHSQFLALSIVYLLSVLMVSRYRDILEPPTSPSPFFDTNSDSSARRKSVESSTSSKHKSMSSSTSSRNEISAEAVEQIADSTTTDISGKMVPNGLGNDHTAEETPLPTSNDKMGDSAAVINDENADEQEAEEKNNADDVAEQKISSIRFDRTSVENANGMNGGSSDKNEQDKYDTGHLSRFNTAEVKTFDATERRHYLTLKLQKALESAAPLLREIMTDFRSFLQRALLGTHGQEIMNDAKVLQCLKSQQGSVIELVMLLCSQEWQTSLQKHAGLAFIELVNEGRLMAHATRDHILRVANEADFIIKRLRAEDVSKHSRFEKETADEFAIRKREEQISDHLRHSSKRRDFLIAVKLLEKMRMILFGPSGAWSDSASNSQTFWRLDVWEDDSRRRKRFVPNPFGRRHSLPVLDNGDWPKSDAAVADLDGDEREKQLRDLAYKVNVCGKARPNAKSSNANSKCELVDESDIDKWDDDESGSESRDRDQFSYNVQCKLIAAGVVVPGTISITSSDVYFDADEEDPLYKIQDPQCLRFCDNLHGRWHFQEIRAIFLRRYVLQYVALEIFIAARMAIMFAFSDQDTVRNVVDHLPCVGVGVKYGIPQSRKASLMSPRQIFAHSDMQQKWQRREISNFDYLMFLNTIAGRTYNDLNQYPVFPWVLSNYTSSQLDLSEASNFRNLSKPVGALSESRRKYFQDRFNNWDDDSVPAFHYGTHYSTLAFTLNWLFRIEPFTTYFLSLQNGKLDYSDRLFYSLAETWEHCQRDTHDVKELIPELFYLPEMFSNANHYDFGRRQEDNALVNDVVLPPWAESPEHFVVLHRQALESDLVSCQLNQWIDLIFGYKQRGPEAASATNVFYHLTYEGAVDLDLLDPTMREAVQQQILNFGQTPVQLMTDPHPPRHSVMTMSPMMFQSCNEDLCMLMKFISNSAIVHITANTFPELSDPTVLSISQNLIFALNRWNPAYTQAQTQSSSTLSSAISSAADGRPSVGESSGSAAMTTAELPLTVDPLLAVGNPSQPPARRHLGDTFDQRLQISWSNFVCTPDSKFIFACGYPDYSFRIIDTENATVRQVIYGHGDVVTCLARSEMGLFTDCYIASGSADCTVVLWHFNHGNQVIAGEYNMPGEPPSPRAILTGHDAEITAICVSAEHGIVISGSKDGTVLMHTTQGDLLRHIAAENADDGRQLRGPITNLLFNRDCHLAVFYDSEHLAVFNTSSGRQLNELVHRSAEKVLCAVLSRDGEYIVLGTANGRISVLRLFPLQLLYTFPQTDSPTRCVAVSMNQRLIFGGLESGAMVVFNVDFNKWHYEYKQRYSYR